jgi:hypothetical protein
MLARSGRVSRSIVSRPESQLRFRHEASLRAIPCVADENLQAIPQFGSPSDFPAVVAKRFGLNQILSEIFLINSTDVPNGAIFTICANHSR